MKIKNLENCTGCSACCSVCSKSAIKMIPNSEGFLYPAINDEVCIKCGLCEKVCPAFNLIKNVNQSTELLKTFAAINKNEKTRLDSSSGGIFTALAEKFITENGIVFGVKFAEDFSVIHSWTDSLEGLADFRGSKYLQSVIGDTYKECKEFLEQGRKVLYSGTPCQIQGLKKYLRKEYENLITLDFICHGVPSPLLWRKYIDYREKKSASRTVKTAFRRKNDGWKQYSLSFTFVNDSEYCASLKKDPYMQIFLKDIALRKSCYNCPCRGFNRPSDITIADFWGIQNVIPEMDDDKGTSLVFCNSENGKNLFDRISKNCIFKEINQNDAIKYNPSYLVSVKMPNERNDFYSNLEKQSFERIIKKYVTIPIYKFPLKFVRCFARKIKHIFRGKK